MNIDFVCYFMQADVLNVKLLRNEIETFLDGSKFKGLVL